MRRIALLDTVRCVKFTKASLGSMVNPLASVSTRAWRVRARVGNPQIRPFWAAHHRGVHRTCPEGSQPTQCWRPRTAWTSSWRTWPCFRPTGSAKAGYFPSVATFLVTRHAWYQVPNRPREGTDPSRGDPGRANAHQHWPDGKNHRGHRAENTAQKMDDCEAEHGGGDRTGHGRG